MAHTPNFRMQWESFGGFAAHMYFVRDHHKEVERIAIVTDSHFAGVAQLLGTHFTSAEVRRFPFFLTT